MTTPVSGPGPYSRRTDRGAAQKLRELPDAEYGEAKTFRELQQGAPLAQAPEQGPTQEQLAAQAAAAQVVPLGAPSTMPGTPVTDGAMAGPGQGFDALGLTSQTDQDYALLQQDVGILEFMANQPGASWAVRNLVRRIKGTM